MSKRALCVGINEYPYESSALNGCVNDAQAWSALLQEHFDFAPADVRVLIDSEATKSRIMDGLHWLVDNAASGDVLVFTNSSHGTYLADVSGDEERYDEAICPYDCDVNVVVDDELREIFSAVPPDVHVVAIIDSCHSGTMSRAAEEMETPDHRRLRFLDPSTRGAEVLRSPWLAQVNHRKAIAEADMQELLLSGCRATEYAHDALFGDAYHGAMTYHAHEVIRESMYQLTYDELWERLNARLEASFPQHPQLEGKSTHKRLMLFS